MFGNEFDTMIFFGVRWLQRKNLRKIYAYMYMSLILHNKKEGAILFLLVYGMVIRVHEKKLMF